jgi:hypothetical protein
MPILGLLAMLLVSAWGPAIPVAYGGLTIQNYSFESPLYGGSGLGNNVDITNWQNGKASNIGVITSAGPHFPGGTIPDGKQVIYIQHNGAIRQAVGGFKAGKTYRAIVMANARTTGDKTAELHLKINSTEMTGSPMTVTAVTPAAFRPYYATFSATADGTNTLEIAGVNANTAIDRTVVFDNVSIVEVGSPASAEITPSALAFGTLAPYQVQDMPVTLRNGGDATMTLTTLSLLGTTSASYSLVTPPALPAKVGPGVALALNVRFTPKGYGSFNSAQLKLVTDAATNGTVLVPLTGASSETAQATGWPIQCVIIPSGKSAPVLDGVINVDTEYSPTGAAVPVRLNLANLTAQDTIFKGYTHNGSTVLVAPETTTDDDDLSGVFYFVCDAQALYVAATVKDQTLAPYSARSATAPNGGDCVQVCLDYDLSRPTNATTDGKVFIPSWAAANSDSSKAADFNAFWPTSAPNPMTGTTWEIVTNSTGYVVEARIPWTAFTAGGKTFTKPFPPADGQQMGIMPMLCDFDSTAASGSGNAFLYTAGASSGSGTIGNASQYSTMVFVKTPFLPPNAVKGFALFD